MKSIYLGDGVYESFDGHQIWLAVNRHDNRVVAMEPDVYDALVRFVDKVVPLLVAEQEGHK